MTSDERLDRICDALIVAFPDALVVLKDESHLHVGHAGAATGRGHFRLHIWSEKFRGLTPVARHRAVYAALGELMQTDIHALAIEARVPAPSASDAEAAAAGPAPALR